LQKGDPLKRANERPTPPSWKTPAERWAAINATAIATFTDRQADSHLTQISATPSALAPSSAVSTILKKPANRCLQSFFWDVERPFFSMAGPWKWR
jgi:hypothetical protein